jgi:cation diffusion facilitator family transporter
MDQPNPPSAPRTLVWETRAVSLSLWVGGLLVAVKFFAYYQTKSTAIFSDAVENVVNVLASIFAVYSIRLAHRPADAEHPYGHGKIEFLSAGFEGGMMLLASVMIAVRAAESLALRQRPVELTLGLLITGLSIALCLATGLLLRRGGAAGGSITLDADGIHLLSDAATGIVVLLGLLAVRWTNWAWADPLAALAVSGWIVCQAVGLLRRAAAGLMDEQDAADTRLLQGILDAHVGPNGAEPRICSYHKLRHRHSGRYHWVDFHIQAPAHWDLERSHRAATEIEMEIERALGQCNATAHVEPCLADDCPACQKEKK